MLRGKIETLRSNCEELSNCVTKLQSLLDAESVRLDTAPLASIPKSDHENMEDMECLLSMLISLTRQAEEVQEQMEGLLWLCRRVEEFQETLQYHMAEVLYRHVCLLLFSAYPILISHPGF